MDVFGLTDHATTLVLGAMLILTFYLFGRRNFSYFKELGINGPSPVSHLGNLIEIQRKGFSSVFKYWREVYGDVYGVFLGVNPNLVISDPEFIQEILIKKFSNFTNRSPFLGDEISNLGVGIARDDHWKYLRTVLAPFFSCHQMRSMNTMIQSCADTLMENIGKMAESGTGKDVKKSFSAYTMDVIAATGFGIMVDSQKNPNDPLVEKAKDIFKISIFNPAIFLSLLLPSAVKLIEKSGLSRTVLGNQMYFRKICRQLIQQRKEIGVNENMHKNPLNLMIKAQLKGHEKLDPEDEKELHLENITDWRTKRGITDDEILAQCVIIFLAGYETTASTLTFFTHSMATNPEKQQKLYEEIIEVLGKDLPDYDNVRNLPYLDMCMDETLRILDRQCNKACTIKGVNIPENLTVRIAVDALHYDPKYYPEPEKFIPESEKAKSKQIPFTYLPFGGGPRMCLGMRLAKLEFKVAAVQMIRNFKILTTEKTEGFSSVFKYWREVYGDVYGVFLGVNPNLVISDPEFIQEVLIKKFSNFTNRTHFLGDEISDLGVGIAKDDHWKYLRTVLAPSYSSHQMRSMNTMIQTCADTLMENIGKMAESGTGKDVKQYMQKNLLNLMLKAQLKGHEKLDPEDEKELHLENITDWRTKRGITDDEILAQCVIIFLAGYETTASTLTFFTHLMATNPEKQQKLYEEIVEVLGEDLPDYDNLHNLPYLDMCMDETLRILDRQCNKACTIKGVKIPEKLTVRIAVDALHYDPKYYPEPEKFIPESEEAKSKQIPFTYLPFGGGPRMCLGMRLAKLEFKVAAVQMIRNFNILATEKTENPLILAETLLLAAKNGVWVKFERR
ncbi:cytochrome P450 3A8 [Octopus vulgaris]|uniref:Cytochrome P450 3A8 n=1 Tax=Octopus vulgaris TaxID=6645 RepID=A0AA36BVJ2_OCTVU|nr:cytochrome P450 3A8 [Octopus vulgaris]